MTRCLHRGFTLIELLVALGIAALLLVLATPGYMRWLSESEVQNGALAVMSGMQAAQAEAIKRNANIQFVLDPTTATGSWAVQLTDGTALFNGVFQAGAARMSFATTPTSLTKVTFNPLGQVEAANTDTSAPIERVTVTSSNTPMRRQVVVGGGRTGIRVCDPDFVAFSSPDPKVCPP